MGPLGLDDGAFDDYMVYFPIIISALPFCVKVGIGTFDDCEDCAVSGEGVILLLGFLDLWRRSGWWVGFGFNLRVVVWHCCRTARGYVICGVGRGYVIRGVDGGCG
jgi:hypothetical protein